MRFLGRYSKLKVNMGLTKQLFYSYGWNLNLYIRGVLGKQVFYDVHLLGTVMRSLLPAYYLETLGCGRGHFLMVGTRLLTRVSMELIY